MSTARSLALGAIAVAAVVVVIVVVTASSGSGYTVSVTVPEATGVLAGQPVRAAGAIVGSISSVTVVNHGRAARLELNIDDAAWPLPRGTQMTLRWGGTIDEYSRYIELDRGTGGGDILGAGGHFPASAFHVPVEYGQLLSDFPTRVRSDIKALVDTGGAALGTSRGGLHAAISVTPPALTQANAVITDLDANENVLRTLVSATGQVVDSADTADPGLGQLIDGAGATFSAIASRDTALEQTLSEAPQMIRNTRTTLARANPTLLAAQELTNRLAPGVARLRAITQPLDTLLGTVVAVGPDATSALHTVWSSAPRITQLVERVGQLAPEIRSIDDQANPAVDCIRPYAPEIAAFGTDWASSLSGRMGNSPYIRANPEVLLPAPYNAETARPAQAAKLFPGLAYNFPLAPGAMADQPWYLPQCGVTAAGTNPANDPEATVHP